MAAKWLVPLLAQVANQPGGGGWQFDTWVLAGLAVIASVLVLVFLCFLFEYLQFWLLARLSGTEISFMDLIGMHLRRVPMAMNVRQNIALTQAGVCAELHALECHYLAGGDVPKVVATVIAAHHAGADVSWQEAASLDLSEKRQRI
jgi:uncharacterized protein YqfA (UPF0365 family)